MTAPRPIGYYVHHHGAGHRARAMVIAAQAEGRIVLIGTGLAGRVGVLPYLDLADDRLTDDCFDGRDGAPARPRALHYAPLDHAGVRARVAAVAGWIAAEAPALMVIDVSVEIAMLARLASVPTVVVRLGGRRDDPAHLEAFRAATAILCPFAAALDDPQTDPAIVARTRYQPGLVARAPPMDVDHRAIVVVGGAGGSKDRGDVFVAAARATPGLDWTLLGLAAPDDSPANLHAPGWVDDAHGRIAAAGVVIGGAGNGVVGAVLAARRPFICIPEDRPFDEQHASAAALARAGAAIVCDDPARADWPALIAAARLLDPACAVALDDPDGARHAATWLAGLADDCGRPL